MKPLFGREMAEMSIFASSESTTLPVRTAYQGGTFLFIATMKYNKQPLDIPAQIAMLKGRGLNIADEQAAEKTLSRISYFRLAAYLLNSIEPQNTFAADIKTLLSKYAIVNPAAMGFVKEIRTFVFHGRSRWLRSHPNRRRPAGGSAMPRQRVLPGPGLCPAPMGQDCRHTHNVRAHSRRKSHPRRTICSGERR